MRQERAEERGRQLVDACGDAAVKGEGGVEVSGVRSEWDKVCSGVGGHELCRRAGEVCRHAGRWAVARDALVLRVAQLFLARVILWIKKILGI